MKESRKQPVLNTLYKAYEHKYKYLKFQGTQYFIVLLVSEHFNYI